MALGAVEAQAKERTRDAAGEALSNARVWGGQPDVAPLGLDHDLFVTIPRGRYDALAASMDVTAQLVAPLPEGARVGEVKVSFAGAPLSALPLVSLKPVVAGGLWTKVSEAVQARLDTYVQDLLDKLRVAEEGENLERIRVFLDIAAEFMGLVTDDKAAQIVRRRVAAAA